MARKQKAGSPVSNSWNEALKYLKDPKFQHKCFVRLENCDFTKCPTSSERRHLSTQVTDHEMPEALKYLKDPKFQHKCFVCLENCDFTKCPTFSERRHLSTQVTDHEMPEALKYLKDPKFQHKCFVCLENCDFTKCPTFSERRHLSTQVTDHEMPDFVKTSGTSIPHDRIINEKIRDGLVKGRKNDIKRFESKKESVKSNDSIMGPPNVIEYKEKMVSNIASVLIAGKSLRSRKEVNYEERTSIGTPDISKNLSLVNNKRIPVYNKKVFDSPKCRKRKGDLYDFIPEPEQDTDSDVSFRINIPPKKKKMNHRVHFHNQINKNRSNRMKVQQRENVSTYHDKINKVMNKLSDELKRKQGNIKNKETNTISTKRTITNDIFEEIRSDTVFNSTMLSESQKIIPLYEPLVKNKNTENNISDIGIISSEKINKIVGIPSSENSSQEQDSYFSSSTLESPKDMSIRATDHNNINNLFGFTDEIEEIKDDGKFPSTIKILQNVLVSSPPNYISTPKRHKEKKSWRFDTEMVNRNPHFLSVKKNSLPALSQDPVLDHTFDERIDGVNKVVLAPTNGKSTRQQSILNYIEASKEYSDNHTPSQSLYDIGELSPIKTKNTDKENSSERQDFSRGNQRSRRKILGLINEDNLKNQIFPNNKDELIGQKADTHYEKKKNPNDTSNFGFDTSSEIIENENIDEQGAKPFRIEFTYKKCNKRKKLPEKIDKPVRDSEVRRLIEEDHGFNEVVDKDGLDCGELGLFEDIEESPKNSKGYKFPRKKKAYQDTDRNKAPKEKLTKEAQKWIKQFNEMCHEVENEELEIE